MTGLRVFPTVLSVDGKRRVEDFLAQHGGRGARPEAQSEAANASRGWSEIYAADGHVLRCDWTLDGTTTHMRFSEIDP